MKTNTGKLIGILIGVIAIALLASSVVIFTVSRCSSSDSNDTSATDPSTTAATLPATPDAATTVSPSDPAASTGGTSSTEGSGATDSTGASSNPSDASEPSGATVPAELSALLEQSGHSADSLQGSGQLIVVNSSGTSAEISFFEKSAGVWKRDDSLTCGGYVGVEGTVDYMSEQVSGTPKGLYPIGSAFYQDSAPDTGLDSFAITSDTYWVDDPDSKYSTQTVVGEENRDWDSAEHMSEIPSYRYGFVINYNMPAEYNKGSAIFFHIGYSPTQGCVAASEDMVLAYLGKLSAAHSPQILII